MKPIRISRSSTRAPSFPLALLRDHEGVGRARSVAGPQRRPSSQSDPGMTVKLLQIVNGVVGIVAALQSGRSRATTLASLPCNPSRFRPTFTCFEKPHTLWGFSISKLWDTVNTARIARAEDFFEMERRPHVS